MKSRGVVGKRIVKVLQTYRPAAYGRGGEWELRGIVLQDGSVIRFIAVETEDTPAVVGIYPGRKEGE